MRIGILGVSGFIGGHLANYFLGSGHSVIGFSRTLKSFNHASYQAIQYNSLLESSGLNRLTELSCDVLIDCADPAQIDASFDINQHVNIKTDILKLAYKSGVKRYIYISSVKALTESSNYPLCEDMHPRPTSQYGLMKVKIEDALVCMSQKFSLDLVIVRPPMIYGEGGGASIGKLSGLIKLNFPLPFKGLNNRRSIISITNFKKFIYLLLTHENAAQKRWLVSDREPLTIEQMAMQIASCLDKKIYLFWVPTNLLKLILFLVGQKVSSTSLLDNLLVNDVAARSDLNWVPAEFCKNDFCHSLNDNNDKIL